MSESAPFAPGRPVPRPPAYAWSWLQRSRPVVAELARRLTGRPADGAFVDELAAAFADDPFVRAIVMDTIAQVAFSGRVPQRRPAGVTWDRGLTWWAATLAGVPRREFESGPSDLGGRQAPLFGREPDPRPAASTAAQQQAAEPATSLPSRPAAVQLERRRIAAVLRDLVRQTDGGPVPASSLAQLAADLESPTGP